jgi:hypothetical protein
MNEEISNHLHIANDELKRIANALEEVLRLVKADQEAAKKRWPHPDEKN